MAKQQEDSVSTGLDLYTKCKALYPNECQTAKGWMINQLNAEAANLTIVSSGQIREQNTLSREAEYFWRQPGILVAGSIFEKSKNVTFFKIVHLRSCEVQKQVKSESSAAAG
ncbi:hypothetical protein RUM43_002260 [Polyplax serrata]|uniref:Uncharacterized protein n=1 Tax=Polyplax serrata TaxID=468196 RepID=A0AAN8S963_POLSC